MWLKNCLKSRIAQYLSTFASFIWQCICETIFWIYSFETKIQLNFARSIIESHNHNHSNDWMYNVMQKLPIWLQNWSKSGICKRFFPHLGLKVLNHDPNFLYFNTYLRKIYFPKIFRISGIPCISFQMPTYIFEKKSFIDLKQKKI